MSDWLDVLEVDLVTAAPSGTELSDLVERRLGAVLLRGLYPPSAAESVAAAMEARLDAFPRSSFPPEFRAHFLGRCLDLAGPSLSGYFDDAERFRVACAEAFEGHGDFEGTIRRVLSQLSGGLPVEVPTGPGGARYALSTVRTMDPGGFIPPHIELEQVTRPPYAHLRGELRPGLLLSFYLVLRAPTLGGELGVSAFTWDRVEPSMIRNGRTALDAVLPRWDRTLLAPGPGDLIVFDGGWHAHWVEPVGAGRRWTLGGFCSLDARGERVLCWS